MSKMILMQALALTFVAGAANAATTTTVYQGTLQSREQCADTGGLFARVLGCSKIAIKSDRRCQVQLTINDGNITKIDMTVPEIKANGETRQSVLTAKVKGPYLYESKFVAYSKTIDKKISMEMKSSGSPTNQVLALNVYTDHVDVKKDLRHYKMYSCVNFKRVK